MAMVCPRCGNDLISCRCGSERLDGCRVCGGIWLHCDELNRLIRDPAVSLEEVAAAFVRSQAVGDQAGSMACPLCGAALVPYRFPAMPDLPAHVCATCRSVWLDDGGMRRIADRVAAARARPTVVATCAVSDAPAEPAPVASAEPASAAPAAEGAEPPPVQRPTVSYLVSAACPRCEAANPPASTRCWSCGAPLDSGAGGKRCWRCHVPLIDLAEGDLRFSICDSCGGVWMEDGRLAVLLQLDAETFEQLRRDVRAIREQARARREREEAERMLHNAVDGPAGAGNKPMPHGYAGRAAASSAQAGHPEPAAHGHGAPPQPPARSGGHGLLGLLRGRGHDRDHEQAVVSHAAPHPPADAETPEKPAQPRCPACRYEMHPHEFGHHEPVVACICAHCRSMWFDEGGVAAIYTLVQREGMLSSRGGASDVWARD